VPSRASRRRTSKPDQGANRGATTIDIKKEYADHGQLMAAVRMYCLGEYERIWGRLWDNAWPELRDHILKMREVAQEAHEVWTHLRRAVKHAADFVKSQGLRSDEEFDPDRAAGNTVYESIVIHDWLNRHLDAVDELLSADDFEKVHSPRSVLAEFLGRTRLDGPAPPAGTIQWKPGLERGRELTEREMAYVSLLVGNEPRSLKTRLEDELVSVENVIEMEREAINTARARHDEAKRKDLADSTAARSSKPAAGERRAKGGPRRPRS
jgi:hypothetical protein